MYRETLLIGTAALLAGCQMTGGGTADPQLVRFCQQIGYTPESSNFQGCLERYSMAGRGLELDPRAAGRPGGGP